MHYGCVIIFDAAENLGGDPINALAYADDLVLLSRSKVGLQRALDAVAGYCSRWKLEINYKKTKCMTFSKGSQKESWIFNLGGHNLENVREYKYLGAGTEPRGGKGGIAPPTMKCCPTLPPQINQENIQFFDILISKYKI